VDSTTGYAQAVDDVSSNFSGSRRQERADQPFTVEKYAVSGRKPAQNQKFLDSERGRASADCGEDDATEATVEWINATTVGCLLVFLGTNGKLGAGPGSPGGGSWVVGYQKRA